jgi:hypothetical protein
MPKERPGPLFFVKLRALSIKKEKSLFLSLGVWKNYRLRVRL